MAESDKRSLEADRLKNELLKARLAEKDAKEKLLEFLSQPAFEYPPMLPSRITDRIDQNGGIHASSGYLGLDVLPSIVTTNPVRLPAHDVHSEPDLSDLFTTEMDPISLEIEKERHEYLEKSKHLQEQLKELKLEIEGLKLEEKQTQYDILHQEQVLSGENKYSTLRKIKSGSTKSRVAFFEEL
ncbi:unnamed protein product [Allacma fusca]|uniref:Ezrin/radixin/moesin C-terminal domain-containing protein n=1 Tax=Allacma fusca TaxID=39272 RepID=A0A8J2LQJ5_9HEXA|nr:unnamed protein product [Allacma fusca]